MNQDTFDTYKAGCPSHENGDCTMQPFECGGITLYQECEYDQCPMMYWFHVQTIIAKSFKDISPRDEMKLHGTITARLRGKD